MTPNRIAIALLAATLGMSACSTDKVVDRTVDQTLWVGKTAVKGTVGAGKMVVRGGKRVVADTSGT